VGRLRTEVNTMVIEIEREKIDVAAPTHEGPETTKRVVIVGSGPAGLTAAIYAARANLDTTVLAGLVWGGQLMLTSDVENFPGFAEGIMGPDLMMAMRAQAERVGAKIVDEDVVSVDFSERPFTLNTDSASYHADAVIIATGAAAKWLNIPSEERLRGKGISTCATCDGFFYRGQDVAVIGGGDSALEEALYLARIANKVTLIHRRDQFRGSKIMQQRVLTNPKIEVLFNTGIDDLLGDDELNGVRVFDAISGAKRDIAVAGVFVAIGHEPNTSVFKGKIDLDEKGYVHLHGETHTNVKGVFVAGDVFDIRYRQAITAAGSGCKAAMDAEKFLEGEMATEEHHALEMVTPRNW
jgi:thioredoxin reductase (NADPH)